MKIVRLSMNTVPLLKLRGRIVGSFARSLEEELYRIYSTGSKELILDFKEVSSIDSFGISVLSSYYWKGLEMEIVNIRYSVRSMFKYEGMTWLLKATAQSAQADQAAAKAGQNNSGKDALHCRG
jgi:anti-anti-sigma factor